MLGALLSIMTTSTLQRFQSRSEAAAALYRELIPFLRYELQRGPVDNGNRSVQLVGNMIAVEGEHPREAFMLTVDSVTRLSQLSGAAMARTAIDFREVINERRGYIEAYTGASESTAPDASIFEDVDYRRLTARSQDILDELDDLARATSLRSPVRDLLRIR